MVCGSQQLASALCRPREQCEGGTRPARGGNDSLQEPTIDTSLRDTKAYLETLKTNNEPITIRRLIGYWGYESRGKNRVQTIYRDLAKMGLRTNPPFDGGHLDLEVLIERDSPEQVVLAVSEQPADHLLTLSRIDSAMYALRLRDQGAVRGFVTRETLVSDALTLMMRHDFSQLPVVESLDRPAVVGISPGSRSGSRRCGVRVPPLSAK